MGLEREVATIEDSDATDIHFLMCGPWELSSPD